MIAVDFNKKLKLDPLDAWDKNYKLLEEYFSINGHSKPHVDLNFKNVKLGRWVVQQRRKKSGLTKKQKDQLNDLEFDWGPRENIWNLSFKEFQRFVEENGHSDPKDKYKVDDFDIGGWCYRQRNRKDQLDTWQIQKLDAINFNWTPPSER